MKININAPWGDSTDTSKHSKDLTSWYSEHPKLKYAMFRLPSYYAFDLKEMQNNITQLLADHNTISIPRNKEGKQYNRYKGLGFFSRKEATNPLTDHFTRRDTKLGEVYPDDLHLQDNLPNLYEDDFTTPTKIYNEYFQKVFSVFKNKISKASILELKSKGYLGSHVDFPYYKNIRLHATIFGGETAWYEIDGTRFQIPQDGHWYFIDTGKYHSIWNEGPSDRLTINVNLADITADPMTLANNLEL